MSATPSSLPVHTGAIALAREVLRIESEAVAGLIPKLDTHFTRAVELILGCKGRVVVSGIGKSGHVARKIAATFASTGTPAFFVHPAEASHGDLGMVTQDDVLVAISYSGEAAELMTIVPIIKREGARTIAITGQPRSSLAQLADAHLDVSVAQEACPLNLAPTASTTATLAMGDALAVACLEAKGFGPNDFARSHPGGALGRKLLTTVGDVMHAGDAVPRVALDASVHEAILEMTKKRMGMTAVIHADGTVAGIFTDGDLRRTIERVSDIRTAKVSDHYTKNPVTIGSSALAVEALALMEARNITQLIVAAPAQTGISAASRSVASGSATSVSVTSGKPTTPAPLTLVGALNMQDLFRAKVV